MPTAPASFTGPLSALPAVNLETVLAVVMTLVFIWWAIFTLVVIYHWFRYARDSWVTVPVLVLHVVVSGWIFVFAIGGFH